MERETPAQTRKSLELVEAFKKAGIGFVPMPILGEDDRAKLCEQVDSRLEQLLNESE